MPIIGSCGHQLTDADGYGLGWIIATEDSTRDCNVAIVYRSVCTKCRDEYRAEGLLLETAEQFAEVESRMEADAP